MFYVLFPLSPQTKLKTHSRNIHNRAKTRNPNNNNYYFTQGPLRATSDTRIHSARASSPTFVGEIYDLKCHNNIVDAVLFVPLRPSPSGKF